MVAAREFTWDVLAHSQLDAWLDELREHEWCRDASTPGVRRTDGTIAYRFIYIGPHDDAILP